VPLAPVLGNAGQVGINVKARHPHAAMLFADYLLGDGQKIIAESGYHIAGQPVPYPLFIPEQGRTLEQIESDLKLWDDLFRQLGRS
jgi:iron(III) transport system substrate-binding protein